MVRVESPKALMELAHELSNLNLMLDDLGDEPVITANQLEMVRYCVDKCISLTLKLDKELRGRA